MQTSFRFKLRILPVLVLVAAIALATVVMIRRSHHYAKLAEAAHVDLENHTHSAKMAEFTAQHQLKLAESLKSDSDSVAHAKHNAEKSRMEQAFFEEQASRAGGLERDYTRLASRPWESEPESIEETRRQMLDARHPSFPYR